MSEKNEKEEKIGMPVKQELFLEAGVHIGTKIRTDDMKKFIFKRRDDGLYILDIRKSAERLMTAAKLISKYKPEDVVVVASRIYSSSPANKFAELTGTRIIKGRFVPGTMTNMKYKGFLEPQLLIICDPKGEREALVESVKNGVPTIAFCDTDNETKFVDLVVPINNKGKRSLALAFYILTRELLMAHGEIKSYDEFKYDISYFEQLIIEEKKKAVEEENEEQEIIEELKEEAPVQADEKKVETKDKKKDVKKDEAPKAKKHEEKASKDEKKSEKTSSKEGKVEKKSEEDEDS